MSDEWEPYFYSLAWIAFREESLLQKMRAAPSYWASKQVLFDAGRLTTGDLEQGPCRSDLRPYIYRVGGCGDAAFRLTRELRAGRVRSRYRFHDRIETWSTATWAHSTVHFVPTQTILANDAAIPRGLSYVETDRTYLESHISDVRAQFHPSFTLQNFQGLWKPVPHDDRESLDDPLSLPGLLEGVEAKAVAHLAARLAKLDAFDRQAFRRCDALSETKRFGLSARAFDRVWADARRRAGLPSRAPAGRKAKGPSRT